jgi:colicin import membrane protein
VNAPGTFVDCTTGAQLERPLTADEQAALAQAQAAAAAALAADQAADGNRQTMSDRATQAIANLNAAAAALDANTATAAQQRAALSLCCKTTARLARIVLDELDAAD